MSCPDTTALPAAPAVLIPAEMRSRARGCMLGQLAGDSLGSLVEFLDAATIRRRYPNGVRLLADGGPYHLIAGQPTDDSEMALAMARVLAGIGRYDVTPMRRVYRIWLLSHPFDCGITIGHGILGTPTPDSQANGALMRVSPLGIFGAGRKRADVMAWAKKDAAITHVHPICGQANALFAALLAHAVREGGTGAELYETLLGWMKRLKLEPALRDTVERAAGKKPRTYQDQMGWVLIALQNALWQMLHAPNFEEGVVDTVMQGGDTDTNAAIAGALLGAMYGEEAVPAQWRETLLNCRPEAGRPGVRTPRPERYWPVDALELADAVLEAGWKA